MAHSVYFDFLKKGNNLVVAAVVYQNSRDIAPVYKKVEVIDYMGNNQYEMALFALSNAISAVSESGISGEVCLYHQNSILIQWIHSQTCNSNYLLQFTEILEVMERMALRIEFYADVIDPKSNLAKKFCKLDIHSQPSHTKVMWGNKCDNTIKINSPKVVNFRK